jgi:hypothetical protein
MVWMHIERRGVHVKFLTDEKTDHRVLVSSTGPKRRSFRKKSESVSPICFLVAALRQLVSRIRCFEQRRHERLDKCLVIIDQGLAVRGILCHAKRSGNSRVAEKGIR